MSFRVKCLKCGRQYEDIEPENYYCEDCLTLKKKIAQDIDRQFANRPTENIETPLQQYDKMRGDGKFININDFNNLGI